jgi:hypothetical protein
LSNALKVVSLDVQKVVFTKIAFENFLMRSNLHAFAPEINHKTSRESSKIMPADSNSSAADRLSHEYWKRKLPFPPKASSASVFITVFVQNGTNVEFGSVKLSVLCTLKRFKM